MCYYGVLWALALLIVYLAVRGPGGDRFCFHRLQFSLDTAVLRRLARLLLALASESKDRERKTESVGQKHEQVGVDLQQP